MKRKPTVYVRLNLKDGAAHRLCRRAVQAGGGRLHYELDIPLLGVPRVGVAARGEWMVMEKKRGGGQ